jgi:DMSO/TMAO reductase YedYZ molybdopterin-dependent catalytic subunit
MSARLHIGGHVQSPRDVTFADLSSCAEQVSDSSLMAGRELGGVPLAALLALVHPLAGARSIVAESVDGSFMTTLALDEVPGCVIVYRVGPIALPTGLGGPFRLFTEGRVRSGDVRRLGSLYVSETTVVECIDSELISLR